MGQALPGGCLCGSVRFSAVPQTFAMDVCHCAMCQKWTGGVFMAVPCNEVTIENESTLGVYTSSGWAERVFCTQCGTSLFWRMQGGGHVAASMQAFDDRSRFLFTEEIFIDEKPETYAFANATVKKTGAQVMAEFSAAQDH